MSEVEVFFLMMGLWLVVAMGLGLRRPNGLGGHALRSRIDAVYGEPHELVRAEAKAFPEADLDFYDRAKAAFEQRGYRFVADVEDLTLSKLYPQNRTFLRLFVDAGGMVRACAYHLHPRGAVVSLLQLVQLFPRHLRVVELVTEVRGQFLVTSNTHGVDRLEPPPEAKVERLPLNSSLAIVVDRHEARIRELVRVQAESPPGAGLDAARYASAMRPDRPRAFGVLVAWFGFTAWVGGASVFLRQGVDAQGRLVRKVVRTCALFALLGWIAFALGLRIA